MYTGIRSSLSLFSSDKSSMKLMVVLTDGIAHDTTYHTTAINEAKALGVKICTVGLGTGASTYFDDYLKPLAEETGGLFKTADKADELDKIYEDFEDGINVELDSDGDNIPDWYETNMVAADGTPIPTDPKNYDTDGDGRSDGEEVVVIMVFDPTNPNRFTIIAKMNTNPTIAD